MEVLIGLGLFGMAGSQISNENRLLEKNQETANLIVQENAVSQYAKEMTKLNAALNEQTSFYSNAGRIPFSLPNLKWNGTTIEQSNYPRIFLDAREFCDNDVFNMGTSFLVENYTGPGFAPDGIRNSNTSSYSNCSVVKAMNGGNSAEYDPITGNVYADDGSTLPANIEYYNTLNNIQKIALSEGNNSDLGYCQTYDKWFNYDIIQDAMNNPNICNSTPTDLLTGKMQFDMCVEHCTPLEFANGSTSNGLKINLDPCTDGEINTNNPFCRKKDSSNKCKNAGHAPFLYKGYAEITNKDDGSVDVNLVQAGDGVELQIPCMGIDMFGDGIDMTQSVDGGVNFITSQNRVGAFQVNKDGDISPIENMLTCTGTATIEGNWMGGTATAEAQTTGCTPAPEQTGVDNHYVWPNLPDSGSFTASDCVGLPRFRLFLDPFYVPEVANNQGLTFLSPEVVKWRQDVENSDQIIRLFNIYSTGLGNIIHEEFPGAVSSNNELYAQNPEELGLTEQTNYFQNIMTLFFGDRSVDPNADIEIVSSDAINITQLNSSSNNNVNPIRQPLLWLWTHTSFGWACNQWGGTELLWNVEQLTNLVFSNASNDATVNDSFIQGADAETNDRSDIEQNENLDVTIAAQNAIQNAIYANGAFFQPTSAGGSGSGVYHSAPVMMGSEEVRIPYSGANRLFTVSSQFINVPLAIAFYAFYQVYLQIVLSRISQGVSPLWTAFFAGSEIDLAEHLSIWNDAVSNYSDGHLGGSDDDLEVSGDGEIASQLIKGANNLRVLDEMFMMIKESKRSYGDSIDRYMALHDSVSNLICNTTDSEGKPIPCNKSDPNSVVKSANNIPLQSNNQEINCLSEIGHYMCPKNIWKTVPNLDDYEDSDNVSRTFVNSYIKEAVKQATQQVSQQVFQGDYQYTQPSAVAGFPPLQLPGLVAIPVLNDNNPDGTTRTDLTKLYDGNGDDYGYGGSYIGPPLSVPTNSEGHAIYSNVYGSNYDGTNPDGIPDTYTAFIDEETLELVVKRIDTTDPADRYPMYLYLRVGGSNYLFDVGEECVSELYSIYCQDNNVDEFNSDQNICNSDTFPSL